MKPETIEDLRHADRFKPFIVNTDNGQNIEVDHPDFIFMNRSKTTVLIVDKNDRIQIVDMDHISSVTMKGPAR